MPRSGSTGRSAPLSSARWSPTTTNAPSTSTKNRINDLAVATAVDGELLQLLGGIGLESGRIEDQVEPAAAIDDLEHRLPQREPTDRRVIDHLLCLLYPLDIILGPPLRKLRTALLESLDESTEPGIVGQMTRGIPEL